MKVNLRSGPQNSFDTGHFRSRDVSRPPATPDHEIAEKVPAAGDLTEPLGFDGIWIPDALMQSLWNGPEPLQVLAYFAGRTEATTGSR